MKDSRKRPSAGRFQGNAWLVRILPGQNVAPDDEIQMKPRHRAATLISRSQAECSSWDGECTVLAHLAKSIGTQWFEKSADVCPHVRN